jgi:hypothetical protein
LSTKQSLSGLAMFNKVGILPSTLQQSFEAISRSQSRDVSARSRHREAPSGRSVNNKSAFISSSHNPKSVSVSTATSFFRSHNNVKSSSADAESQRNRLQPSARERRLIEAQRCRHEQLIWEHLNKIELFVDEELQKDCEHLLALIRRALKVSELLSVSCCCYVCFVPLLTNCDLCAILG